MKTLFIALSFFVLFLPTTLVKAQAIGINSTDSFDDTSLEIVIAADSWCPFNCLPDSTNPGYMIEIAQYVFAMHNIRIRYQVMPWTRAIELCRAGKISAIVGGYKSDAPDFIYPSNEQGEIGFSFFGLTTNQWRYQGIESLTKQTLGIAKGYAYTDELDDYIKHNHRNLLRLSVAHGDQPLKKNQLLLQKSLIDIVVETDPVFWYSSNQNNTKHLFTKLGTLQLTKPAYIAFSPALYESKKYAQILSKGTEDLRKSGKLSEILAKYGLVDWQSKKL